MQLHEKYRPKEWGDVVGQDKAVATLRGLDEAGKLRGRAFWIQGRSGNAKTTLARIVARKVSTPKLTSEYDAGEVTAQVLRDIQTKLRGVLDTKACPLFDAGYDPLGGKAYCIIVNEAHRLRPDAVTRLLNLTEAPYLDVHAVWIFTTTLDGQMHFEDSAMDAGPLLSRCMEITLAQRGMAGPAAARLKWIADQEGLDGRPVKDYERLFHDCQSNFRKAIQKIEAGAMLAV